MNPIIDPVSGLAMGWPDSLPFPPDWRSDRASRLSALDAMILSASGWRRVFAAGGEESRAETIGPADRELMAAAASVFARFVAERKAAGGLPTIAVGLDTRPTGPAIADIFIRTLAGLGLPLRYLFIVAVPEFLAWVRLTGQVDGFAYISASHNPVGHNGIKFGLADGAVLAGDLAAGLIADYRRVVADDSLVSAAKQAARAASPATVRDILAAAPAWKADAARTYREFSLATARGGDGTRGLSFAGELAGRIALGGLGLVIDMNGSARSLSIDRELLSSLGAELELLNDAPREFAHAILPEGASLEPCRAALERQARARPVFRLGYVPDCDGDRGNLVYWNPRLERAEILEAQTVFALACVAELSWLEWSGLLAPGTRCAVVVNDATSLRIERIAAAFGADVQRVEVGEANVVNRARELRSQGWLVRILGEGSNGGNITHPATVRDPLNTLLGLIRLLYIPGPFELWRSRAAAAGFCPGGPAASGGPPGLPDVLDTLPHFSTTGVAEPEALMRIRSTDHGLFKTRYERLFRTEWESRRADLARLGFASWEEINYEGTCERRGFGPSFRSGAQRGGLKMLLKNAAGRETAFVWMRGSGTEPVFRVLADVEGGNEAKKKYLLDWQRDMIARADQEGTS